MTLYLEQYLDSLQNLPNELRRNLTLLGEWDANSQKKLRQLETQIKAFASGCRDSRGGWSKETRNKKYAEIKELFKQVQSDGENKVSVANQTYELVDKHIRKLDADLARFEADLKRRFLGGIASDSEAESKTPQQQPEIKQKGRKRKTEPEPTPTPGNKGRKKKAEKVSFVDREPSKSPIHLSQLNPEELANLSGPALFQQLAGGGADVMDMPVDPNEPTYCLCHQVSYGEMVGCDNPDCPIEWFHFACVNLSSKPKGKWFCPRCLEERKKKNAK